MQVQVAEPGMFRLFTLLVAEGEYTLPSHVLFCRCTQLYSRARSEDVDATIWYPVFYTKTALSLLLSYSVSRLIVL